MKRLLIANRSEIACRIIQTAHRLGIETIAVYSQADKGARHTRLADEAYLLSLEESSLSYLNQDALLQVAQKYHVDAIHPGYGFLSEHAPFANACSEQGFIFVGPSANIIQQMGDKSAAKRQMQALGVPIIPGYQGSNTTLNELTKQAENIGFPILIKATAGGGGKGMRIATHRDEFLTQCKAAQREAEKAFGDGRLFLERFLQHPRHIEVQIIADHHGQCFYLGSRDCSIQRRYQKVIEEAPAPNLSDTLSQKMQETAVQATQKMQYTNAGTFEFLVEEDNFYFLEMNTRLQVEHPVTEAITGLDLVALQLHVAMGQRLDLHQDQISFTGHAIEARLYAEDASEKALPSTGVINTLNWHHPKDVRIDSGFEHGDYVSSMYDPLVAKIITWQPERQGAIRLLGSTLTQTIIEGISTNQARLLGYLNEPSFISGTHSVYQKPSFTLPSEPSLAILTAAALLLLEPQHQHSVWFSQIGWRMSNRRASRITLACQKQTYCLSLEWDREFVTASSEQEQQVFSYQKWQKHVRLQHEQQTYLIQHVGANTFFDGAVHWILTRHELQVDIQSHQHDECYAPTVGRIIAIHVEAKQAAQEGSALVTLEAMKMEYTLRAKQNCTIASILCQVGQQVNQGQELLQIEELEHA